MATTFRRNLRFTPKNETRFDEFKFDGGLITDAHETKLETNQSPNLENVTFNETGSIATRNGYTRYNTDPIGAASDTTNFGSSTGNLVIDAEGEYAAQTFVPSGTINTVQVDLSLAMTNADEEQRVRVELWSISGGEPSAILTSLAESQTKLVTGTSEATYSFRIRTPIALTTATTYAIVLKPFTQGSSSTVNSVEVHHTGNAYASGSVFTSTDSGETWAADTAKDLKFTVYSGGNTGGTGLVRFYGTGGIKQLFTKIGTSLYRGNDSTGAMTAITLGSGASLTAANYIDWTISNGTLLLVDETNKIQKYRGSTNANYSTGTITVENDSPIVTGASTVWATATNAEAGEYIKLPDGKWYKILSIASNTSLVIEVDYQGEDAATQSYVISPWGEVQGRLDALIPASLVRPTPSFIENYLNRIWTLEEDTLRFSTLDTSVAGENFNDFDTSANAGTIIIPSSKGASSTGLYSFNDSLYIFQRRAIWRLYGNSPANFELRNVSNEIGMVNRRTLVEWGDLLLFLSYQGVQIFDGTNLKNISDGAVNVLIDSWANKSSASATLWDNKYLISYTPSGGTYNSEAIFYDLVRNIWGKMTNLYASVWSTWGGDNGEVYFISSNQGSIHKWDSGTNDDGYEISTIYDTPSISFKGNVDDKIMKKFYLQQLARGDYNMTVTMFADLDTETTKQISLSPGDSSLWDVAQWDEDSWSSEGDILTERIAEFQGLAKYFKFRLEQEGLDQGIEALGITATVRKRRL